MSKSLLAVALVAALSLAVLGKEFTIMNYPGANCTGTATPAVLPLDACLPIPPGHGNFTSCKFGMPRDVTIATIYPEATANCTSLGQAVYVPCGRCMDSGHDGVGFYRYLCDVKNQTVRAERMCDEACATCADVGDVKVGQCVTYDNGTKTFILGALARGHAIPEIVYNGANQTCTREDHPRAFDVPCGVCLGQSVFNCTLTSGVQSAVSGQHSGAGSRLQRLAAAALGGSKTRHGRLH